MYIFWLLSSLTQSLLPEFQLPIGGIGISLVYGNCGMYVIASIKVNRSLCLSSFIASAWGSRGAVRSLERGISAWNISRDVASLDFKCRLAREIEFHAVHIFSRVIHSVKDLGFQVGFRAQGRPWPGPGLATLSHAICQDFLPSDWTRKSRYMFLCIVQFLRQSCKFVNLFCSKGV